MCEQAGFVEMCGSNCIALSLISPFRVRDSYTISFTKLEIAKSQHVNKRYNNKDQNASKHYLTEQRVSPN